MRSKAPLAMMEEMVMILVFALAAALCLQAFVKSDQMSEASEARDRAAVLCQSAAEAVRAGGGDLRGALELACGAAPTAGGDSTCFVEYDAQWNPDGSGDGYVLIAEQVPSEVSGLGKAVVRVVSAADDSTVFELEVAWQEVDGHE